MISPDKERHHRKKEKEKSHLFDGHFFHSWDVTPNVCPESSRVGLQVSGAVRGAERGGSYKLLCPYERWMSQNLRRMLHKWRWVIRTAHSFWPFRSLVFTNSFVEITEEAIESTSKPSETVMLRTKGISSVISLNMQVCRKIAWRVFLFCFGVLFLHMAGEHHCLIMSQIVPNKRQPLPKVTTERKKADF